ncbi:hypothetical protein AN480_27440 (plasmid) [Mycobacterium intracellulare subsp. chimaera]|nr:hypothetical protein AN480_27440 [Mycobacterium intracellulare subsp. chimaera]
MEEIRRWDDDPVPEVIETIVCEVELAASVSEIFLAVDEWLRAQYQLSVPPSSWQPGDTGPGTGVVILLEGACVRQQVASEPVAVHSG